MKANLPAISQRGIPSVNTNSFTSVHAKITYTCKLTVALTRSMTTANELALDKPEQDLEWNENNIKHLSVAFDLFISSVNDCLIGINPKLHLSALNLQRIISMKAGVFFFPKLCLLNPTIFTPLPELKTRISGYISPTKHIQLTCCLCPP